MHAEIGEAAGLIWRTLESEGPMTKETLKSKTRLDSEILNMALGWLSREDKIRMERKGKRKILSKVSSWGPMTT